MARTLRFHPLVASDLADAVAWYSAISHELGNRFRDAVNHRLDTIESRPESFGIVGADLRVARLPGFPYVVVYEMSEDHLDVFGIFHAASDPNKWRRRK